MGALRAVGTGRGSGGVRAGACAALLIWGCSDVAESPAAPVQARILLQGLEALVAPLPDDRKQRVLSDVEALELSDEGDRGLRNRCLRAHRALQESERGLVRALASLNFSTERHGSEAEIPAPELARVQEQHGEAEHSLGQAKQLFGGCLEGMGQLRVRLANAVKP